MYYDTNEADSARRDDLLAVLIESDGGSDFGGSATGYKDAYILLMDTSGDTLEGVQLSLKNSDMDIEDGTFIRSGLSFYFAGSAPGFQTELQTETFTDSMTNGMIFKYEFDHPSSYDCVYEWDVKAGAIRSSYTTAIGSDNYEKVSRLDMEQMEGIFLVYQSPYSGGFELKDSFTIPRPCAASSINMTEVTYYYGQREMEYDMSVESGVTSAYRKMENPLFMHQNGTEVGDWLAYVDGDNDKIYIQTDDQNFVDTHRTWIEGCTAGNDLMMVNLYIDVIDNSAPSFVGGLQTTYRMEVGDKRTGKIPYYEDDEEHNVIAYLNAVPGF
jgi:hypothetical protein